MLNLIRLIVIIIILNLHSNSSAQTPIILDTLAFTQITNLTDIRISSRIRTSADGSKIIFTGNFKMVYTIYSDGSGLTKVFDYSTFRGGCPCIDVFIDISGDGKKIIWTDGINEIFTANFDGSNRKEIASILPGEPPFADPEPDIRIPPRITFDGSAVYFFNVAGGKNVAGLYKVGSDGTGLTKLFSYTNLSGDIFGLDGNEFNPNTAFSNFLDISDDGSRGIFATHSQDIGNGHTITFNNSTLSLLRNYGPMHANKPTGIGPISISRDGSRVAVPFRDGSAWVENIYVMNFDGTNQIELPFIFSTGSTFQLDHDGSNLMATYHLAELAGSFTQPIATINVDSSKILDLTLLEGNPEITFRGVRFPVVTPNAKTVFFLNGVARGDSIEQIWQLDINPKTLVNHPEISDILFSPNYVTFDWLNNTTISAQVTPNSSDLKYVNWDTFMDGSYVFRALRTSYTEQLFDDGTMGDLTSGDGIYARNEISRDLLEPPASLTIRIHADAGKYITSVDAKPLYIIDSIATNINSENNLIEEFSLYDNYPNPFNPNTIIKYSIPIKTYVKLNIFDSLGQKVLSLVNSEKLKGNYEVTLDGANLKSGVYYYQLQTRKFTKTKKMILLK